jgi:hypothetical protein
MDKLKQLKIIFYVLAAVQLIYFFIVFILVQTESVTVDKNYSTTLGFIVPLLVILTVVGSKIFYSKSMSSLDKKLAVKEKLYHYQTKNIIRYSLFESANLLSITSYLLTGDFLYVGLFVIVMLLFFINIPDKEKFVIDFGLSSNEADQFKSD